METGFEYKEAWDSEPVMVFYLDPQGKDISFERWRITLYYAPNFAKTHFEPNEEAYNMFLAEHKEGCYDLAL